MNIPTPKNITEARRQANIVERANAIAEALKTGREYVAYHNGGGVWSMVKRSYSSAPDTIYSVNLLADTCTCPDFQEHGDICKHLVALNAALDEEAQDAAISQMALEMEAAECANGTDYSDGPTMAGGCRW